MVNGRQRRLRGVFGGDSFLVVGVERPGIRAPAS